MLLHPTCCTASVVRADTVAALDAQNILLFCNPHRLNEHTSPQTYAGCMNGGARILMVEFAGAAICHS